MDALTALCGDLRSPGNVLPVASFSVTQIGGLAAEVRLVGGGSESVAWLSNEDAEMVSVYQALAEDGSATLAWPHGLSPRAVTAHAAVKSGIGSCVFFGSHYISTWRALIDDYGASNHNANHAEDASPADLIGSIPCFSLIDYPARVARVCVERKYLPVQFAYLRASSSSSELVTGYAEPPSLFGSNASSALSRPPPRFCFNFTFLDDSLSVTACAAVANTVLCSPRRDLTSLVVAETESAALPTLCAVCFAATPLGFNGGGNGGGGGDGGGGTSSAERTLRVQVAFAHAAAKCKSYEEYALYARAGRNPHSSPLIGYRRSSALRFDVSLCESSGGGGGSSSSSGGNASSSGGGNASSGGNASASGSSDGGANSSSSSSCCCSSSKHVWAYLDCIGVEAASPEWDGDRTGTGSQAMLHRVFYTRLDVAALFAQARAEAEEEQQREAAAEEAAHLMSPPPPSPHLPLLLPICADCAGDGTDGEGSGSGHQTVIWHNGAASPFSFKGQLQGVAPYFAMIIALATLYYARASPCSCSSEDRLIAAVEAGESAWRRAHAVRSGDFATAGVGRVQPLEQSRRGTATGGERRGGGRGRGRGRSSGRGARRGGTRGEQPQLPLRDGDAAAEVHQEAMRGDVEMTTLGVTA